MRAATDCHSRDDWDNIVSMFRAAEYTACLNKLQDINNSKARLLRVRTLMRLNRDVEALQDLSADTDFKDAACSGEFESLSSILLIRLSRLNEARLAQTAAREHLASVTAWAIRAELRYHESCLYFAAGEHQKSYEISVSSERDIGNYYEQLSHDVISVSLSRATLLNAKAIVDLSCGRYQPAYSSLIRSVSQCQHNSNFDVGEQARILSNLSSIMNDQTEKHSDTLKFVTDAYNSLPWTRELAHSRFDVLREIGYALTLEGQFTSAFETFRLASCHSASHVEKLLSTVAVIDLLRDLGSTESASNRLSELVISARQLDLLNCRERDADALLLLAEKIAEVDVQTAESLLDAYKRLEAEAPRLTTVFTDERFDFRRLRVASAMAAANGDAKLANSLKRQTFDSCNRLGLPLEACRIALDLPPYERGRRYRNLARDQALCWPKSSFAVKARRVDQDLDSFIDSPTKTRKPRKKAAGTTTRSNQR